jgi:hypothetical protein
MLPFWRKREEMGGDMRAAIPVAILVLLTVGLPKSAFANTFQTYDADTIDIVAKRLLNASRDNVSVTRSLNAARRFDEISCLNTINDAFDSLYHELSEISTLVTISSVMDTSYDEATVIRYLRIVAHSAMEFLPLSFLQNKISACAFGSRACSEDCDDFKH